MKILSVLLLAFVLPYWVLAQYNNGLYVSVDFAPGAGKTDTSVDLVENPSAFADFLVDTNTEISMGYQWSYFRNYLRNDNIRFEVSYQWMSHSLDNTFNSFSDFVPDALKQFIRFEGLDRVQGPSGSLFYDFDFGLEAKTFSISVPGLA